MGGLKLTITASNKNRLRLDNVSSKFFIQSIQHQTYKDFEVLIVDGGSDNYEELKKYFISTDLGIPFRIVQHKIGKDFQRALLNNVGVRNGYGEYIMTTDVDIFFGKEFVATLLQHISDKTLIESRTLYWKEGFAKQVYDGKVDIFDTAALRVGKTKKRTTAGACQCMSMKDWHRLRGFNEEMIGWGSEDVDLVKRAEQAGMKIVWMGERRNVMLFHQPHPKIDIKYDMKCQNRNKKIYQESSWKFTNLSGWGGKN